MNQEKIGKFLKSLREEMKWSQEQLASKMFVDRTLISKWENGKILPDVNRLIELSNIFDVKIEEILAGERDFNVKIQNYNSESAIKKYLLFQNSKYRKLKLFIIGLIILAILLAISFFGYYFFQNYNKIKVYKIYGTSEHYELNNGIFLISREKMYFNLGKLFPESKYITLYYKNNEKIIIYDGDPTNIIIDSYNFNSLFNTDNIDDTLNNLYIDIYESEKAKNCETMKLNYNANFQNDTLVYDDMDNLVTDSNNPEKNIPEKILKEFSCTDTFCSKEDNDIQIVYEYYINIVFITAKDYEIKYDFNTRDFLFEYYPNNDTTLKFKIANNSILCEVGNCNNAQNIFKDFKKNFLDKYWAE